MVSPKCKALKYFIADEKKATIEYGKFSTKLDRASAKKVNSIKRQEAKHKNILKKIYAKIC